MVSVIMTLDIDIEDINDPITNNICSAVWMFGLRLNVIFTVADVLF